METLKNKVNYNPELVDKKYLIKDDNLRIAVIGDMHLHHSTPASRIDDYPSTCVQKLSILRRELNQRGIKYVVCAGDIFHIPKERSDFEYMVFQELLKFKEDDIKFYVTIGNHDLSRDRIDSIEKSTLGICFLTELLLPFTEITFQRDNRNIVFTGTHFPNDIEPVKNYEDYNIQVCHKFYENTLDANSLTKSDLEVYGYNMYICGHDHVVYPLEEVATSNGLVYIVRPGSFMRGTAHKYNTDRMVYMDILSFTDKERTSGKIVSVERVTLPVKEPKEIFSATVLEKSKKSINYMTQELTKLVNELYTTSTSGKSVYDVLDNNTIDASIKSRIVDYLEQFGIFRKN